MRRKRRILIIDGHPDADPGRLVHGLAAAYGEAADAGGHAVRTAVLATLDIVPLRSRSDWEHGEMSQAVGAVQQDLLWADHLVLLFPLWLGDMPALLKALLEQALRPGFAFREERGRLRPRLQDRSAHIIVTMGMPGMVYRLWFGAHAVKLIRRSIFGFVGIRPVRTTMIGSVERQGVPETALRQMTRLGRRAR
ncbi:hypothetical protein HY78_07800 [Rhizorhabdus wittichii DC-6]|nr:hypothetical protein HY78_07800 [Rhizorhabdus wittichii DC-6]